jgi:hypothetical protein
VDFYEIPTAASLGVVAGILTISILASLWKAKTEPEDLETVIDPTQIPEESTK